eukprot:COSAG05_NODE_725_length_7716_cov_46.424314_4_plen_185_part_00
MEQVVQRLLQHDGGTAHASPALRYTAVATPRLTWAVHGRCTGYAPMPGRCGAHSILVTHRSRFVRRAPGRPTVTASALAASTAATRHRRTARLRAAVLQHLFLGGERNSRSSVTQFFNVCSSILPFPGEVWITGSLRPGKKSKTDLDGRVLPMNLHVHVGSYILVSQPWNMRTASGGRPHLGNL